VSEFEATVLLRVLGAQPAKCRGPSARKERGPQDDRACFEFRLSELGVRLKRF